MPKFVFFLVSKHLSRPLRNWSKFSLTCPDYRVSLAGRQRWTQSLSWPEQWVLEVPAGRPQRSLVVGGILSIGPCLIYPELVSMTTTSSLPILFILKRFPPQLSEPGLLAQLPYQPTAPEPRFSSDLSCCQRESPGRCLVTGQPLKTST